MNTIQSFTLNGVNDTVVFKKLPGHAADFFQELYRDSNAVYALYKLIDTKFYKSDYVDRGFGGTGYKYDRFVDNAKYYLLSRTGELTEINKTSKKDLNKIRESFAIATEYKGGGAASDEVLKDFVAFLNNNATVKK
jgi:hypothetical protein